MLFAFECLDDFNFVILTVFDFPVLTSSHRTLGAFSACEYSALTELLPT